MLHLGNGCSASAVRGGVAVETSMGLTPLQGLVMGTRSGDVDPGLHAFLHNELGLSVGDIDNLLNKQSGLKGLAGVNDFRELQQRRAAGDRRPSWPSTSTSTGSSTTSAPTSAILGRIDVLTFTAGVGENNPALRAAVVDGLDGLGISVDPARNEAAIPRGPGDLAGRLAGHRRRRPDQRGAGHRPGGRPAVGHPDRLNHGRIPRG